VINTSLSPILHRFRDYSLRYAQNRYIWLLCSLAFNRRRMGFLYHSIVNDISLQITCFGLHFCRRKFGFDPSLGRVWMPR